MEKGAFTICWLNPYLPYLYFLQFRQFLGSVYNSAKPKPGKFALEKVVFQFELEFFSSSK